MEAPKCEICQKVPAKFKCEDCDVYMCPADIRTHKEDLPDSDHNVVSLKAQAKAHPRPEAPQEAVSLPVPVMKSEESKSPPGIAQPQLPLFEVAQASMQGFSSLPVQVLNAPESEDLPSLQVEQAPVQSEAFAYYPPQFAVPNSESGKMEAEGQRLTAEQELTRAVNSWKLPELVVNRREVEAWLQAVKQSGWPVKIIGVYGSVDWSMWLISSMLHITAFVPENLQEGIVGYMSGDVPTMCFYFKVEQESTYMVKPYVPRVQELVYLRALFELCPAVVCCISEDIQRNWNYREEQLAQDFEEISVVLSGQLRGKYVLTNDRLPLLFVMHHCSQQKIIERLGEWFAGRNDIIAQKNWGQLLNSAEDSEFYAELLTMLEALSTQHQTIVSDIRKPYETFKAYIRSELENYLNELFYYFEDKFHPTQYSTTVAYSLNQIVAKIKEDFVDMGNTTQIYRYWEQLKGFVASQLSPEELERIANSFFTEWEQAINLYLEDLASQQFYCLREEMTRYILQEVPHGSEICSIKTFGISLAENEVRAVNWSVETRFFQFSNLQRISISVLSDTSALAVAEEGGQVLQFNPIAGHYYAKEEATSIGDPHMIVASGSTSTLMVAFCNGEKRAFCMCMESGNSGADPYVYGDCIGHVKSACILHKARRCLIINELGQVFDIELDNSSRGPVPVLLRCRRKSNSREGQSGPESFITGFYEVQASADEQLYYLLDETAIHIYDSRCICLKEISLRNPISAFKLLKYEEYQLIITQSENEMRAYRVLDGMNMPEQMDHSVAPSNPILDMLSYSFVKNSFNSLAKSQFYLYPMTCKRLCEGYVALLFDSSPALNFRGTIEDYSGESCLYEVPSMPVEDAEMNIGFLTRKYCGFQLDQLFYWGEASLAKAKTAPIIEELKLQQEEALNLARIQRGVKPYTIFCSRADIAQTYKLSKWMLHPSEAQEMLRTLEETGAQVKVIGVYGPIEISRRFIGSVLNVEGEVLEIPKDPKEGIMAYFRADSMTLCFYYKIEIENTYLAKPYFQSSREAVFVRLLFDLCPVVICCISEEIQQNWYWNEEKHLCNPFLPRVHSDLKVKVIKRIVDSSEVQRIEVKLLLSELQGPFMLTNDQWPYIFQVKPIVKDLAKPKNEAIHSITKWLFERGASVKYSNWSTFLTSYKDYQISPFPIFISAINKLSSESTDFVRNVRKKYESLKEAIKKEAENFFNAFYIEFQTIFTCTEKDNKSWISKNSIADFHSKMWEQFVIKFQYHNLKSFYKEAKTFVVGVKGVSYTLEKKELSAKVTRFFEEQNRKFLEFICGFLNRKINELLYELIDLIQQLAAQNENVYSVQTLSFDYVKGSLQVRDTEMVSRILLGNQGDLHLHVLDREAAFATVTTIMKTVKFNPTSGLTCDTEVLPNIKSKLLIAYGSTVALFVAFSNEEQRAFYGRAPELKEINQGNHLEVYGFEVHYVRAACILQKKRRVLLINEVGNIYLIDIKKEPHLTQVLVNRRGSFQLGEPESLSDLVPLTPSRGSQFYDVKSCEDETMHFLLSDGAIEVYDLNYTLTKCIEVQGADVCFKVLSSNPYKVVITLQHNELKAFCFRNAMEYTERMEDQSKKEEIPGNPIIDIVFHAFHKFGCTNPESKGNSLFYFYSAETNPKCESYLRSIPFLTQALDFRGTIAASHQSHPLEVILLENITVSVEDIKWRILSRAPIHLCSIQDGNLIPLQNGFNYFDDFLSKPIEDFSSDFESYVKLGALESIIEETQGLKVVAIIGRQSSGKSYLLNRLFGTRFDVAAHRCTDGIWLSFARIENQVFLVMDCEGLFSVERTEQEEIKLCLLLAAIADVTILNQDLTFSRHISSLLEKFSFGMERIKGSILFKGCLEFAIRDVPANQDEGTNREVRKFVDNLIERNKADFLVNMFTGSFLSCSYHNFESQDLFETAVNARRKFYLESIPVRWTSGKEFLRTLKMVMHNIFTDDSSSIDSRSFKLKLDSITPFYKRAIEIPSECAQVVFPENPEIVVTLNLLEVSFKLRLFDISVDLVRNYRVFDEFLAKYVSVEKKLYYHNDWYKSIDDFMAAYFEVHQKVLFASFETKVDNRNEDFRQIYLVEVSNLERIYGKLMLSAHNLCRKKCQLCDLECLSCQDHKDQCDCSTSHQCPYMCTICGVGKCSQIAGHRGDVHFCTNGSHICGELCCIFSNMKICGKPCVARPYHEGDHRCSAAIHPCGAKCSIDICNRTCTVDVLGYHEFHDCRDLKCPYQCSFCSEENPNKCMESHFHSITGNPQHFCENEHPCGEKCPDRGICSLVNSPPEVRRWESAGSSFNYYYVSQKGVRLPCRNKLSVRTISHAGPHTCFSNHKCEERCPDCKAYCENPIGHDGLHYSPAHRNKENCIYLSKNRTFEVEIEEGANKSTHKLQAGDSAGPEYCDQCCKRKGRGHTHPIECQGGYQCLQRVCPGKASHSQDSYEPDTRKRYDLVECVTYWKRKGWEPPLLRKDPQMQEECSLCPCYCADPDHSEKIYCEGKLFHTSSRAYKDHLFSGCLHSNSSKFDIVFILDCTSSMRRAFPQVKESIAQIIEKYLDSPLSCKFAIVGYTDHTHHKRAAFPSAFPVDIYPKTRNLESFELQASENYLTHLEVSGGGKNGGEAMVDGMHMCNTLIWRREASHLVFIIGDEGPHGREFSAESEYPDGCPCGFKWKAELSIMKAAKAEIRFIQLSTRMNATAELFSQEYGPRLKVMSLRDMSQISEVVVKSIVKVIEHSLEFARASS